MTVRVTRKDALVENVDWPDEGCSLQPSCRTCPLPHCRYEPGYRVDWHRADLRARIAQQRRSQGASIEELMRELGIGRRTVFRLLNRTVR